MRNLSLFFILMAAIAIWNLTSCTGGTSVKSGNDSIVDSPSYVSQLEEATTPSDEYVNEVFEENEKQAEQQMLEEEQAEQESLVGTYEIDDGHLGPIVLTVNDDETATLRYKNDDTIYYGSWYKYDHMKYAQFHFEGEQIYVNRPKAVPQLYIGGTSKFLRDFVLFDGYLYTSSSAAKAKNPNERLEYKRVS